MANIVLILLNYNDYETCEKFLENTIYYNCIDKIIIVDNNSSDNSFKILSKYKSDKIDIIQTDENKGYAYGNNFGIKFAMDKYNAKFIIISNPDIKFTQESVLEMKKELMINNDLFAVNTKIVNKNGIREQENWPLPNLKEDIIKMLYLTDKVSKIIYKRSIKKTEDRITYNDVLSGCFFMLNAKYFNDIEGFDERTFLYCEERILGYKVKEYNLKQATINNLQCVHEHSVSINKNIKSDYGKYKILFDSRLIYYKYYLKLNSLYIYIFKCMVKISLLEKFIINKIKGLK